MSVIAGEGRVPILYGGHAIPVAPYRSAYLARPDAVDRHPGVALTDSVDPTPPMKTLARHLARYGYAAVVPPGTKVDLAAAVDAFGGAWGDWSRADRRAVLGIGAGAVSAAEVATERSIPLVLLSPSLAGLVVPVNAPVLVLSAEATSANRGPAATGRWVVYRGLGAGFWDDASADYSLAAATDALSRLVGFLDRHLGVDAAAA